MFATCVNKMTKQALSLQYYRAIYGSKTHVWNHPENIVTFLHSERTVCKFYWNLESGLNGKPWKLNYDWPNWEFWIKVYLYRWMCLHLKGDKTQDHLDTSGVIKLGEISLMFPQ